MKYVFLLMMIFGASFSVLANPSEQLEGIDCQAIFDGDSGTKSLASIEDTKTAKGKGN